MANCIRCGRQLPPLSFKKVCQWCVRHEAAQRGEDVDDRQPVITQPWVRRRSESAISLTQIIFGVNVAVFLAMALSSGTVVEFHLDPRPWGANYGPLTLSGDWWRLVTYMFVHAGLMHIGFNMWCLWDLGALCESLYGRWTFLAIYLITGIGGGLARLAWDPYVPSVGASGAIFGLAGALIASFYLGEFSLPRSAISGTLRSLVIFAVFNLVIGRFLGTVDNACHVGGLVTGLILGAMIARLAPQEDAPARRATVIGVLVLVVLAAGFGIRQWRGAPMRMARLFQDTQADPVARWRALVKEQPNLVPAHFALAQAYMAKQQFPEAEAELKRILQLQPSNPDARFGLGTVYLSQKRLDEAKSTFAQMLSDNPSSPEAHYGMGLVLAAQQNDQGAIDEFKKASGTRASGVYFEMGNSYARLKRYDDAIAAYLKEKDSGGDDPDLENALADAYLAKAMGKEAQAARDRAQRLRGEAH